MAVFEWGEPAGMRAGTQAQPFFEPSYTGLTQCDSKNSPEVSFIQLLP